ncbi:MAG: hypothetical protein LUE13_04230 [Akkermansiaceae bacterium]|nr:hypothetical protein [Akkermansiaceae bacterium]
MNSINTINGVLVAAQSDFASHAEDKTLHLREEEREAWNAKADASAFSGKVDKAELTAHETNTTVHITDEEREKWNARNTKGAVVATQDGLDEHTENASVHITPEERDRWNSTPELDAAGNMALAGGLTTRAAINANGGVNIPLAALTSMTNATAVNACWAAGMIGLSDIWQYDIPVSRKDNDVYGDGELIDWPTGGQGVAIKVPKGGYCSAVIRFPAYLTGGSWGNYGEYRGFYLPLGTLLLSNSSTGICGKVKFTWATHGENPNRYAYQHDASDMDAFAVSPKEGNNSPVVDVTIGSVLSGNASVRVRAIYYDDTAKELRLTTVMSSVPFLNGYGERVRGLIFCQGDKDTGVWLVAADWLCRLATIPKLSVYELPGMQVMHVDVFGGDLGWTDSSKICFSRVRNFNNFIFRRASPYDVLEAIEAKCQVSKVTEPWSPAV